MIDKCNITFVDGKLMRKMIDADFPYWMQLRIIHHDNKEFELNLGFIKKLCSAMKKTILENQREASSNLLQNFPCLLREF